eukprot:COSAG01_NODE_7552_length_3153_cov_42.773412_5_plen_110_part_00
MPSGKCGRYIVGYFTTKNYWKLGRIQQEKGLLIEAGDLSPSESILVGGSPENVQRMTGEFAFPLPAHGEVVIRRDGSWLVQERTARPPCGTATGEGHAHAAPDRSPRAI